MKDGHSFFVAKTTRRRWRILQTGFYVIRIDKQKGINSMNERQSISEEQSLNKEQRVSEEQSLNEERERNANQELNKKDVEQKANAEIIDMGQITLEHSKQKHKIHLLSVIGEIEGHECLSGNVKSTKYEHILPKLAAIEDDNTVDGVLVLINTVGGDVESGLAIAEMIASLSKPTVSLVLGGSHSIGVPLAVSTDYSYIVPTGTMVIHPVRLSGLVIGAPQTYDYFQQMQDRIVGFVSTHCFAKKERLEEMMLNTGMLTKDLGTILVGGQAVEEGIINEVGGIDEAMKRLHRMIDMQ